MATHTLAKKRRSTAEKRVNRSKMPEGWYEYLTGPGRYYTQEENAKKFGVTAQGLSYWMYKLGLRPKTLKEALAELRTIKGIQ